MDVEAFLYEKYRPYGVMRGEELSLRQSDALRFIEDCRALEAAILGLDFYVERRDGIVEVGAADFSSLMHDPDAAARSAEEARRLIEGGLPDGATWVSFVLEDQKRN